MTRVGRDFGDMMKKGAVPLVSADVIFATSRFPNYKIGANNQIVEVKEDPKVLSMKEVAARETALLLEQQKRLSVCDLASKFEKGLASAAKLSDEVVGMNILRRNQVARSSLLGSFCIQLAKVLRKLSLSSLSAAVYNILCERNMRIFFNSSQLTLTLLKLKSAMI